MLGLNDYQTYAARTTVKVATKMEEALQLAVFGLGLGGEAGEVQELLKKHLGHGHELDKARVEKELGDVLWYIAGIATLLGLNLEDIAEANIQKLQARYPQGFDPERSQNRGRDDL